MTDSAFDLLGPEYRGAIQLFDLIVSREFLAARRFEAYAYGRALRVREAVDNVRSVKL